MIVKRGLKSEDSIASTSKITDPPFPKAAFIILVLYFSTDILSGVDTMTLHQFAEIETLGNFNAIMAENTFLFHGDVTAIMIVAMIVMSRTVHTL